MAIKTFGKTITGSGLAVDGDRLLLQHPQTMAECMGHVVPYQMPHEDGGFLILAEYGTPNCDPGCGSVPAAKTTCGGGCGCASKASCTCEKKADPMKGSLLRFEIVEYSGFDSDGVTAIITGRGAEGTIKQEWPAGTVVLQSPTGSELDALGGRIKAFEALGCLLSVPAADDCATVKEGEWRCFGDCFRRAVKDLVIAKDEDANDTSRWSECFDVNALLDLLVNQTTCETFPTAEADANTELLFCKNGAFGKTTFSELLDKACVNFPEAGDDVCNITYLVKGTDTSGCSKAYAFNASNNCFPRLSPFGIGNTSTPVVLVPDDPDKSLADVDYYTESSMILAAAADPFVDGSTIDRGLLEKTLVAASEGTTSLKCNTRLNFNTVFNGVLFDNAAESALSDLVMTMDDGSGEQLMLLSGGGATFPIVKINNGMSGYREDHQYTLPAGDYTFKAYLVGNSGTTDMAQIKAGATQLEITVCKYLGS